MRHSPSNESALIDQLALCFPLSLRIVFAGFSLFFSSGLADCVTALL